jgi:hypothetical protein
VNVPATPVITTVDSVAPAAADVENASVVAVYVYPTGVPTVVVMGRPFWVADNVNVVPPALAAIIQYFVGFAYPAIDPVPVLTPETVTVLPTTTPVREAVHEN